MRDWPEEKGLIAQEITCIGMMLDTQLTNNDISMLHHFWIVNGEVTYMHAVSNAWN